MYFSAGVKEMKVLCQDVKNKKCLVWNLALFIKFELLAKQCDKTLTVNIVLEKF